MMMYSDRDRVDKIEEFLQDQDLEEFLQDNDLTIPEVVFLLWQKGLVVFPDWSPLSETEGPETPEEESNC